MHIDYDQLVESLLSTYASRDNTFHRRDPRSIEILRSMRKMRDLARKQTGTKIKVWQTPSSGNADIDELDSISFATPALSQTDIKSKIRKDKKEIKNDFENIKRVIISDKTLSKKQKIKEIQSLLKTADAQLKASKTTWTRAKDPMVSLSAEELDVDDIPYTTPRERLLNVAAHELGHHIAIKYHPKTADRAAYERQLGTVGLTNKLGAPFILRDESKAWRYGKQLLQKVQEPFIPSIAKEAISSYNPKHILFDKTGIEIPGSVYFSTDKDTNYPKLVESIVDDILDESLLSDFAFRPGPGLPRQHSGMFRRMRNMRNIARGQTGDKIKVWQGKKLVDSGSSTHAVVFTQEPFDIEKRVQTMKQIANAEKSAAWVFSPDRAADVESNVNKLLADAITMERRTIEKHVNFGKDANTLISKSDNPESAGLTILAHELGHIIDAKKRPDVYKKMRKYPDMYREFLPAQLEQLRTESRSHREGKHLLTAISAKPNTKIVLTGLDSYNPRLSNVADDF